MFDLETLIKTIGLLGIFSFVFAESGLLVGFFLPGDSLLFTAGFLASQGFLSLPVLMLGSFIAAVIGDSVGYAFGRKVGPAIFTKEDSLFFSKNHLSRAQHFYEKHGGKTIVLARFMPFVRTFAPILAGVGRMHYPTFLFYNIFGGFIWTFGLPAAGFYLGSVIPNVDRYLLPIIALIIFVSVSPGLIHLLKDESCRRRIFNFLLNRRKQNKDDRQSGA